MVQVVLIECSQYPFVEILYPSEGILPVMPIDSIFPQIIRSLSSTDSKGFRNGRRKAFGASRIERGKQAQRQGHLAGSSRIGKNGNGTGCYCLKRRKAERFEPPKRQHDVGGGSRFGYRISAC